MTTQTVFIGERIDRPAADVYAYLADPLNLPHWAPGLGKSIENIDGEWFVEGPLGRVGVYFAPPNDFGVLDHTVVTATGESFYNPLRVLPYGDGCEVVFAVRRPPGVSDDEFARDTGTVAGDLAGLKRTLES